MASRVTKIDWTNVPLPVPPAALKHSTTHWIVPPGETLAPDREPMMPATLLWSVPLNGAVTLATVSEMKLAKAPAGVRTASTADPWKPAGHAVVVDQVGVRVVAPL